MTPRGPAIATRCLSLPQGRVEARTCARELGGAPESIPRRLIRWASSPDRWPLSGKRCWPVPAPRAAGILTRRAQKPSPRPTFCSTWAWLPRPYLPRSWWLEWKARGREHRTGVPPERVPTGVDLGADEKKKKKSHSRPKRDELQSPQQPAVRGGSQGGFSSENRRKSQYAKSTRLRCTNREPNVSINTS